MDKSTQSILCDHCENELIQDTSYPARYGLVLSARNYGVNTSNFEYAVMVHPEIEKPHHFCNLTCLTSWVGELHINKEKTNERR